MDKNKKDISDIKTILKKAKDSLYKIYGRRLKEVILYGSYARGEGEKGSDIDLIVLLENMNDPVSELEKCSSEIYQIGLLNDVVISIIPMDVNQYKKRRLPLILNVKKEGVPI
jgi:predicted nucleotidyltransferase